MIEFYLILAAVGAATAGMFWRLLIGTLVMLIAGFMGEAGYINPTMGFIVGMAGWIYILYEIFAGEAAQASTSSNSEAQKTAFNAMKWIVTVGWAIYPLGYMMGNDMLDGFSIDDMNILYNVADLVNKTAFGMMIWYAAKHDE